MRPARSHRLRSTEFPRGRITAHTGPDRRRNPVSLKFALLGTLAHGPQSGYELTQRFGKTLNFVWTASQGAIYPELVRMEREGLIETVESGPRGRKTYGITSDGRRQLQSWLLDPPIRQAKDELILRVFMLDELTNEEACGYFASLHAAFEERLREYEHRLQETTEPASRAELFSLIALKAGIAHEKAMSAWATEAMNQLRAL